jgi:hypothetical protein
MTDSLESEARIEDRVCLTLLLGAFLWLFLLTVDLSKADPPLAPSPPVCEYNCR